MDWFAYPFLILAFVFLTIVFYFEHRQTTDTKNRLREIIRGRDDVSMSEIAKASGLGMEPDLVRRVLEVLGAVSEFSTSPSPIIVPIERLRLSDELCRELGYQLDSLSFFEFFSRIEKEFGIRVKTRDFEFPPTVGDVVRLVASRLDHAGGVRRGDKN